MDRVIYLEPGEEITSVLDKLKNAPEKSIILVIPKGSVILQSLVNLKLLSKRAAELEKEIALVTSDKTGRNLASLVGFSVYSDLKDKGKIKPKAPKIPTAPGVVIKTYAPSLERVEEPQPSRPPEKDSRPPIKPIKPSRPVIQFPSIPFGFWLALFLGAGMVLAIFYFLLTKAEVLLQVKTEQFSQSTDITVEQRANQVDIDNRIIPGEVKELEKEETKKREATGKKNIGGKASGTVVITNNFKNPDGSGSEFPLKANIEIKDKKTGKVFLTNSSVTVPPLTYSCDVTTGVCEPKPGTASVKVTAAEPGESYNIGPSQFSIPGLSTNSVFASSSENMTGGYDKFVSVVSEDDIKKASEEVAKELYNKGKEELKSKLGKGQKLLEGAVKQETLSATSNVSADTQVSEFEIRVRVKISTLVVSEKDYRTLLSQFLERALPSDKRLVSSPSDSVELSLISYDSGSQTMKVKATINTKVAPKINEDRLKEAIAQKSPAEATAYLKSLSEIQDARIKLWPAWAKRLPQADKIKIKLTTL